MPGRLTLHLPDRPARVFLLREGSEYLVGRDPGADVPIDDDRVSRQHARLLCDPQGGWRVIDLGSKNGVAVNGAVAGGPGVADGGGSPVDGTSWLSFGGVIAKFDTLTAGQAEDWATQPLGRWRTSVELWRGMTPAAGMVTLLSHVLSSVLRVSGSERGFVLLARADGELEVAALAEVGSQELFAREFSGSVGAVEQVLRTGRTVATCDALDESSLRGRESVVGGGIRAMVCLPLQSGGAPFGAIYADSRRVGAVFTELDIEILDALTAHAALAISVARLDQELRGLAAAVAADGAIPSASRRRLESGMRVARGWVVVPSKGEAAVAPGAATWSDIVRAHRGEDER